jgi:branched-chain amino acid transport system permease protein
MPWEIGGILIMPLYVVACVVSLMLLGAFGLFFLKSRSGIAMRAVADDQQTAMAMGIDVRHYFAVSWVMAGGVATIGGVIWGSLIGVDSMLALVGLKVFPVVILGGLDSIPGAIVGGLIVGAVESLAAGYLDPLVGGGTKDFAPYVLMILVLMIKPYGLFGQENIERV